MTPVGRSCAIAAAVLAVVTAVAWNSDDGRSGVSASRIDGAQLFRSKGCSSCHVGPDSTTSSSGFPRLTDASTWAGERRPGMSADEYITQSLVDPSAFISPEFTGGSPMPQLELSSEEVDALVDHLLDR